MINARSLFTVSDVTKTAASVTPTHARSEYPFVQSKKNRNPVCCDRASEAYTYAPAERATADRSGEEFAEDFEGIDIHGGFAVEFYVAEDFLRYFVSDSSVEGNQHRLRK